jgi:hypothetical protein
MSMSYKTAWTGTLMLLSRWCVPVVISFVAAGGAAVDALAPVSILFALTRIVETVILQ